MKDSKGVCPPMPKAKEEKYNVKMAIPPAAPNAKKAYKKGGKVDLKPMGDKGFKRLDRPARASGGSIMGGKEGISSTDYATSQKIVKD